ncbi:MAG TPA: LLM class F420-dependent oxidoreductase [Acidimicrobiia bacterium]|jgi:F420-dependent oxidoreductase-like protein
MQLGIHAMKGNANFGGLGRDLRANLAAIIEAEALGYSTVWTAEASGTDAVVPLTWIAAHTSKIRLGTGVMQMAARTPPMTAATAATLDLLSEGRVVLGLGASGPAVVEGWHCQPYGNPLTRAEEYVAIVRKVLARSAPVVHHGDCYDIPYTKDDATGLANPIRLMFRPKRRRIPIYLAAMGPRNLNLANKIADGIVPAFYSPVRETAFWDGVDPPPEGFDISPFVTVAMGDDLTRCRDYVRGGLAFWIGAMGARGRNFYNRLAVRLGFADAAHQVQSLYMSERRLEAAAAIPDELIDEVALVGPRERIRDQLEAWKASRVTTMIIMAPDAHTMRAVAELAL